MRRLLRRGINALRFARKRVPEVIRASRKAREARRWNRDRPKLFAALKAEIEAGNQEILSPCDITLTILSRYFGSEDNLLDVALESLARCTHAKDRLEVMLKLDDDDYLPYFARILRRHRNSLRIRAFVTPRGRGYEDLTRHIADLIAKASPGSKVWQGCCEGSRFQLDGWDRIVMQTVEASGKDLFIGTQASFERSKSIVGPIDIYKPYEIYHIGAEDYPTASFELLNLIESANEGHPNWSCLGSTSFSDAFLGDIIRRSYDVYGDNIHIQYPKYVRRTGSFNWSLNPERLKRRTLILAEFFTEANREARQRVVDSIHRALEEKSLHGAGTERGAEARR